MTELVVDNPYTLNEQERRPLQTEEQLDAVLTTAKAASRQLASTDIDARIQLCVTAMAHMRANRDAIGKSMSELVGKPIKQAMGEVDGMLARAEHMIAIAKESLADVVVEGRAGFERRIQRVPLGVVLNLPAWNYPLLTCINALVPAVLAGNAVVLKHSSRSIVCGDHFAAAFAAAGAAEVVQSVCCDHARAAWMVRDQRVGYVAFTGSVSGGRAIYSAVGGHRFIDAGLELGGKDAAYVMADTDVAKVAASLVDGACYNAGQSCCGVERVYVARERFDDFVAAARKELLSLTMGDPSTDVYLGPMAQPHAPAQLAKQVDEARTRGAQILEGGGAMAIDGKGRFFAPTLLVDVDHSMDVMRSESFGPILPVMAVDSDEEALRLMNDSDLGLTASLWTKDLERAHRLAGQLEVGTVYLNQCDTLDPALPWTGVKDTGKGSTLSALGFQHLTRPRALNFRLP